MKHIAMLLFGISMILFAIFGAVMLSHSDSYLFAIIIIVASILGLLFSILGFINACFIDSKNGNLSKRQTNLEKLEDNSKNPEKK